MDLFGEAWRNHADRIAAAWDAGVGERDVVLLPGDLSWATKLAAAAQDLDWIGRRPGLKILLRGNHDSWWDSVLKVRRALPAGCVALQNDCVEAAGWAVVGARGWVDPASPDAGPEDAAVYVRELLRLRLSVADADRRFGRERPRVAMVHYPPRLEGQPPGAVDSILRDAGVRHVVYGHLHGPDHALAIRGEHDGLVYHFVAADAVGFAPVELPLGSSP